jgi:hypothetical protein
VDDRERLEAIVKVVRQYLPPDGIYGKEAMGKIIELVDPLPPKREWVGLNSFDRTLLRTTYAPLKTLHHIKKTDTDIVAEVVNDWEAFFTAIEEVLKERNT